MIGWTPELIMKEDYLRLTGERYKSFHKYVEHTNDKWDTRGIHFNGYNSATPNNQVVINLWLDQNESMEEEFDKLMLFYPYISYTNIPNEQPHKLIKIVDHTLSYDGVFELEIYSEDNIELTKWVYHRKNLLRTFKSIREAFEYVYKNLPYQRKGEEL